LTFSSTFIPCSAFKVYGRLVGLPYLFETLGQILNDFCALLEEKPSEDQENNIEKSSTNLKKPNATPSSMEVN